jgi:lipopolysaccharide biosynthesis regulator YciM
MLAKKKIHKAMESLQRALEYYNTSNRRMAIGKLDFAKENAQEAIWLMLAELEEKDNDLNEEM